MKKLLKMKKESDRPYRFPEFPIRILKEIPNDYVNESHPPNNISEYPTNHNYSPINFLAIFSALSFVYVFNNTRGSL